MIDYAAAGDLLVAYGEAWRTFDGDAWVALFTEDAEYHNEPFEPPLVGHNPLRAYLLEAAGLQRDVEFTVERHWVSGTTVLAAWQVAFVKQANISNGPQQVNNGTPPKALTNQYAQARTHAEQIKPEKNKLLEENYGQPGQRMDARAAQTTKRSHPAVAAVEQVHRAKKLGG